MQWKMESYRRKQELHTTVFIMRREFDEDQVQSLSSLSLHDPH
jgi:hypothetical protein